MTCTELGRVPQKITYSEELVPNFENSKIYMKKYVSPNPLPWVPKVKNILYSLGFNNVWCSQSAKKT